MEAGMSRTINVLVRNNRIADKDGIMVTKTQVLVFTFASLMTMPVLRWLIIEGVIIGHTRWNLSIRKGLLSYRRISPCSNGKENPYIIFVTSLRSEIPYAWIYSILYHKRIEVKHIYRNIVFDDTSQHTIHILPDTFCISRFVKKV